MTSSAERRSKRQAEQFNEAFPIGTPVYYWPGIRDAYHAEQRRRESVTRTPAWVRRAGGES